LKGRLRELLCIHGLEELAAEEKSTGSLLAGRR
jgi:hypothetical protein